MEHKWINFDEGKSIGEKGSDGGTIIRDEENIFGARVSLEENGQIAPFSITLGIYGVMFHTQFFSSLSQGQKCFELFKEKIELAIDHFNNNDEMDRDSWNAKYDEIMDEILSIR